MTYGEKVAMLSAEMREKLAEYSEFANAVSAQIQKGRPMAQQQILKQQKLMNIYTAAAHKYFDFIRLIDNQKIHFGDTIKEE